MSDERLTSLSCPVVAIHNLNHSYGMGTLRKPVLVNINLEIYPGEIVILAGPSGSGKTTLLTLIGALRSLQSEGSVKVLGYELNGANKQKLIQVRSQIGFIFQTHNLLKCMTARENVGMALKLYKHLSAAERRARAVAILHAVGLGNRVDYYPEHLSVGQKQRVAIARALVGQPQLVLADEPTSALDSKSGRDVVEIMRKLAKEQGCTVLLVTHDPRISDIADRLIHIEDGSLVRVSTSLKE